MKDPKTLNNHELLEKMAKHRTRAFFAVMSVFACMAIIIIYKLHFLFILVVVVPFLLVARGFYKHYNEVQRRHLG
ncbi:hypothetical protein [Mangrovibacterium lignilyticum]|uniref:hypothetical protein n=1 Tax=Mangrovibacterium lignilyticum TaxID=2668052 RepID=UPI0013D583F8|nr:hypothetical protein [Mangrovibacterium lignilyticum]